MVQNQQRVAIVTGASRGIGKAIALRLAHDQIRVVVNYRGSQQEAEAIVTQIRQNGGEAIAIGADVGKVSDIITLFDKTLAQFGQVDILVNNAGIAPYTSVAETSEEDFDRLLAVNIKGTFFACQQAVKHMTDNGRIINFSTSVTGLMMANYAAYAASKGAVEQMTRSLAKEVGARQITVNAVAPGPTDTDLFSSSKTQEEKDRFARMAAFQRLGQPEDIADVVAFLASEQARWITGQTIRLNGGMI